MLIFIDSDAQVVGMTPSGITQGSSRANLIQLVAPFPTAVVTIAFQLPNGIVLGPYAADGGDQANEYTMTRAFELPGYGAAEGTLTVYTYKMPRELTAVSGKLGIQFYITVGGGERTDTNEVAVDADTEGYTLSVPLITVDVYNGARFIPSATEPPANIYEAIRQLASASSSAAQNAAQSAQDAEQSAQDALTSAQEAVAALANAVLKNPPSTGTQTIQGNLTVKENLTVKNLYVKETTYTVEQHTLIARDNIIVTNGIDGATSASGLVINKGNGKAYGILYMSEGDAGDAVYIGEGTLTFTQNATTGVITDVSFEYDKGQALPLAARSGAFKEGHIPVWNAKTNAFESSEKKTNSFVPALKNDSATIQAYVERANDSGTALVDIKYAISDNESVGSIPMRDNSNSDHPGTFEVAHPVMDEGEKGYSAKHPVTVGVFKDALANIGSGGGKVKGTQGVVYELDNTSQEYYVSYLSISSDEIEELVFADYIDGIPVTKIKTYAFDAGGFLNLKRIEIPGTIREIEPYAFCSTVINTNSVKIIMHPGVEIIGANAFLTFASSTVYALIPATVCYIGQGAFVYPQWNSGENPNKFHYLTFANPYHWEGVKTQCKNKRVYIPYSSLSSNYTGSDTSDLKLNTCSYIYNTFLYTEE